MGLLLAAAPAHAARTVSCSELPSAMNTAGSGEVLQLPSESCKLEATVTNTAAFTVQGSSSGSGTVLEPTAAAKAIIQSAADVQFTLSNLTLSGTSAAPAVYLTGPGEAVTLSGDTFSNDSYPSGFGAGVSVQLSAASTATEPTRLIGDTFADDHASSGGGAALLGSAPLLVRESTFTADSGSLGAGGLTVASRDEGTGSVEIAHTVFGGPTPAAGDTSEAVGGGAEISLLPTQPLTLAADSFENDRIVGSAATQEREGAGLFLGLAFEKAAYPVTQSQDVFSHDTIEATQKSPTPPLAAGGGGEWIDGLAVTSTADRFLDDRVAVGEGDPPEGGALGAVASAPVGSMAAQAAAFTGRDDLFSGNSTAAGGWGGAIYVGGPPPSCSGSCPGSSVTLDDSTVVGNSVDAGAASQGGAIWGSPNDSLSVANSIVYGNTPQPEVAGFGGTSPGFAFSDVCSESGGPAVSGAGDFCANPQLESSGAETAASPTIDAGSNELVPAGLSTDIAGNPRIVASRPRCTGPGAATVDMGAFEFTEMLRVGLSCPPEVNCAAASAGTTSPRCLVACADAAERTTGKGPVVSAAAACPPFGRLVLPKLKIGSGRLHERHGTVAVRLTYSDFATYCAGNVTLSTAHAVIGSKAAAGRRHVKREPLVLGNASFKTAVGVPKTVEIHLTRAARALLARRGVLAVVIRASAGEGPGRFRATAKRATTLRRAGRRR